MKGVPEPEPDPIKGVPKGMDGLARGRTPGIDPSAFMRPPGGAPAAVWLGQRGLDPTPEVRRPGIGATPPPAVILGGIIMPPPPIETGLIETGLMILGFIVATPALPIEIVVDNGAGASELFISGALPI